MGHGCADIAAASEAITSKLYESGRFVYDTENGASNYTTAADYFECEEFVDRIKGGECYGEKLNCTDCATIVSTLANALGAELYQCSADVYVQCQSDPGHMYRLLEIAFQRRIQLP